MMLRQTAWRVMLFTVVLASTALAGPLEDLKPGEWYEIPDSKMNTVDPCPTHDCDYSGSTAQNSVMGSWGGGAYDVVRDRLIVWGGGHTNYGGNELYVFDLNTLAWSRLTNPSSPAAKDVPYSSDGQPTSRHTYDYVQYVPAIDAFCSFGGSAFYLSGQTGTNNTDCYYFASKQWVRRADMPSVVGGLIAAFSAVDGTSGHVWVHGTGTYSTSAEYDATTDQWVPHGRQFTENTFTYAYTTAAIDPVHRLFITVGGKFSAQWDMSKPGEFSGEPLVTSGDQTVVNADGPGFVYDSVDQVFVGWAGGTDVYTLDPHHVGLVSASRRRHQHRHPNSAGQGGRRHLRPLRLLAAKEPLRRRQLEQRKRIRLQIVGDARSAVRRGHRRRPS